MNYAKFFVYILILLFHTNLNEGRGNKKVDYLLKKANIEKTTFNLNTEDMLVTNIDDDARHLIILLREVGLKHARQYRDRIYRYSLEQGKLQKVRKSEEFPCQLNGTRSPEPPTSVDKLRPGDIDVVAAIGDSLSAGSGMLSETVMDIISEYRGMSFSGGGMADWRTATTLPNILKVFNPNLYGYSTANVLTADRRSYLNIAEPMIMSRDLVYQAHVVIERMRNDPRIDMQNHWKLLTIFVGSNDICSDMCHNDDLWEFVRRHEDDLRKAFTLLRDNVPRLVINLVPAPNMVTTLYGMQNIPFVCRIIHYIGCNCIFSGHLGANYHRTASEFAEHWHDTEEYVAALPEFQTDDFAVLYQTFMGNISLPILPDGKSDLRFIANDCFHFSQLGHAALSILLWNNMLQAPGEKESKVVDPMESFQCPTADRPYIATLRNSRSNKAGGV